MGRRTVLLVASVMVAALGTLMVFLYASKAQSAAAAGQSPVEVLVATDSIPAGSTGAAIMASGDVELRTLPKASVPEGALSNVTGVTALLNAAPIYAGQVLIADMFTGASNTTALTLPKGTMAMSVELEDPERVAGFVTPGSDVAVFASVDMKDKDNEDLGRWSDLLLDRVRVVAVGPSTLRPNSDGDSKSTNTEEIPTAILTLAVTTEQAKRLALTYSSGDLHLALLDSNTKVQMGNPVAGYNVFQ
ncbi:MAG: Flp pilus assembly protein CpaB [Candidatus Nanopelagicales bacterium]